MRGEEDGFTLIEVIVALAVFTAAVAILYDAVSGSRRGLSRIERDEMAFALAKVQFASAGRDTPLADGQELSGEEAGIAWRLKVERYAAANEPAALEAGAAAAYWLRFEATWTDGPRRMPRSIQLSTLKLGSPP